MSLIYKGQTIFGPRGPSGPDGNPIGTILSFMGTKAPQYYLVCDGSVLNISEYPQLAEHFKKQFGAVNYFGGDGTSTFALPDLRNLFLRGYHDDGTEKLSGNVGEKQDGTWFPHYRTWASGYWGNYGGEGKDSVPQNADTTIGTGAARYINSQGVQRDEILASYYTSRPVNAAVLYCIKAIDTDSATYSTEETRIGTWIDGKPLYRMSGFKDFGTVTTAQNMDTIIDVTDTPSNLGSVVNVRGCYRWGADSWYLFENDGYAYDKSGQYRGQLVVTNTKIQVYLRWAGSVSVTVNWVIEYTKTTD